MADGTEVGKIVSRNDWHKAHVGAPRDHDGRSGMNRTQLIGALRQGE